MPKKGSIPTTKPPNSLASSPGSCRRFCRPFPRHPPSPIPAMAFFYCPFLSVCCCQSIEEKSRQLLGHGKAVEAVLARTTEAITKVDPAATVPLLFWIQLGAQKASHSQKMDSPILTLTKRSAKVGRTKTLQMARRCAKTDTDSSILTIHWAFLVCCEWHR